MTTERDPATRIVLSWLRQEAHENAERVLLRALDEVDTTPQRHPWWPAWRTHRMTTYPKLIAAAAAVLVVAIGGYQLLPGRSGSGGANATAAPSPALLARGNFMTDLYAVELEAIAQGPSVTGRMTVSWDESLEDASSVDGSFIVDLQCTRTTEDGMIMIGGVTTEVAGSGSVIAPVGSRAAVVLKPGSPVQATIWAQRGGHVIAFAPSCPASLDEQLLWERGTHRDGESFLEPIEGTVELGP